MTGAIIWNIDPVIFHIGKWGLRYYSLLFAGSFVVGWYIMQKIFKNENIPEKELDSLSMHMILGTIIGARLGHVIFYEPAFFIKNPLEILMVWHGGLASHGAAAGLLIALYLFTKKSTKKSYLWTLDRAVIPISLAAVLIRTGNLMNSEIFGMPTDLPFGFIFIRAGEFVPRHPTQIYEAAIYLATFIFIIYTYWKSKGETPKGLIFGIFLTGIFATRFFIEFLKKNQVTFEDKLPINLGQILSIPLIIAGIYLIYKAKKSRITTA